MKSGATASARSVVAGGREPILGTDDASTRAAYRDESPDKGSMADITREELDAKLGRTEAAVEKTLAEIRTESALSRVEMVQLRSDLREQMSSLPSKSFLVGVSVSIVAILIALFALAAQWFGNGIMAATSSVDKANIALQETAENKRQIALQFELLQRLLDENRSLRGRTDSPPK